MYTVTDVSAAKLAEKRLFRLARTSPSVMMMDWDIKANVIWVNPTFSKVNNMKEHRDELRNVNMFDMIRHNLAPESAARCSANLKKVLAGEKTSRIETYEY